MQGISAVIITLNEEKNIGRCIDSLAGVADEIIVLDSFSNDRTAEICREKNIRFIQRQWEGYAATKNFANNQARYEYILSIDADEALSDMLKQSVLNAKKEGLKGIYEFNRLTSYCGKWVRHGGWYPDRKIRLFPKSITRWQGEFVHETLSFSGNPHKTLLKGDLLHYSYYSTGDHRQRIDKYAELEAKKLLAKGKSASGLSLFLNPVIKFLKMYLLKFGFLDGYYGLVIALMSAYATYRKYSEAIKIKSLKNAGA